jgi:hypothetical protein
LSGRYDGRFNGLLAWIIVALAGCDIAVDEGVTSVRPRAWVRAALAEEDGASDLALFQRL